MVTPQYQSQSTRPRIRPHITTSIKKSILGNNSGTKQHSKEQNKRGPGNPNWKKGVVTNPNGRPKGVKNKNTLIAQAQAQAAATGVLPLQFMLNVMRDVNQEMDIRLQAATAAAPYLHRKQPVGIEHIPGRYGSLTAQQLRQLPTPALQRLLVASQAFYSQLVQIGVAHPEGEVIDVEPT